MELKDLLFILGLAVGWYFLSRNGKKKSIKNKNSAADWLQVKQIDDDGLITTEEDQYVLMLEVLPIASALKSNLEFSMVWSGYRDLLNIVPHTTATRIETHPYNLDDYFNELKSTASDLDNESAETDLMYIADFENCMMGDLESNMVQDKKYYIRLETNAKYLVELAANFQNPMIQDLIRSTTSKNASVDYDTIRLELWNSARLAQSIFHSHGLWVYPLDSREAVLSYLHKSANRDEASAIKTNDLIVNAMENTEKMDSFGKIAFDRIQEDLEYNDERISKGVVNE